MEEYSINKIKLERQWKKLFDINHICSCLSLIYARNSQIPPPFVEYTIRDTPIYVRD